MTFDWDLVTERKSQIDLFEESEVYGRGLV